METLYMTHQASCSKNIRCYEANHLLPYSAEVRNIMYIYKFMAWYGTYLQWQLYHHIIW
jgi:hypothetical protein